MVYESGFWRDLPSRDRDELTTAARFRVFQPGSVLCTEGEPTTHVFILLSGWVKIIAVTRDGREILEALRGTGDVIGEIAGQVTGYRTATVQAVGRVQALIADARQFEDFLEAHPKTASAHRRAMAQRQQAANEQQRAQAQASGPRRLAGLLLDLNGPDVPPLSQEDLANLIGASRSTVTRALHQWRSRRIIGTDLRRVEILNRPQLMRIAGRDSHGALSTHVSTSSSSRTRRTNADHWPGGNSRTIPDRLRESLTSTDCLVLASSTQPPLAPLALLLRQLSAERRLGRPGIQRPSVWRAALLHAASRYEGVESAGDSRAMPPAPCRHSP